MSAITLAVSVLSLFWTKIKKRFQRKIVKVISICCIFAGVVIYLRWDAQPRHHKPFEAPSRRILVHGVPLDSLPEPTLVLSPFPSSPMRNESKSEGQNGQHNPWLAAVISAAGDAERRILIRSSWMQLFRDVPFDGRFVVSNPGQRWTEAVASENRTYGDMIVLDNIAEDDVTANTVKTLELYKWLIRSGVRYEFVSKMDTDLWLNARGFWDRFLVPRMTRSSLGGRLVSIVKNTVIGELYYSKTYDLVFPQGAMYTMTWDMVERLVSLQERFQVVTGEDMAPAVLMLKGRQKAKFVNFKGTEKFDYDDADTRGDGTAWARMKTHPNAKYHAITAEEPIAVHHLKDERLWNKVSDCFDQNGIKEMPPHPQSGPWRSLPTLWHDFWTWLGVSGQYDSRFDLMPGFLWEMDEEGDWICDGIWNLGKSERNLSSKSP
ncbi:hypothetical protein LA080_007678 [Diaporthe eres]|uniref:Hexosyltransferase n=1 Tax=Diaporthe vaccinii TaxID=105482 RepID=A0ABR4EKT2_9PEZI|nr:hypothetical protein LA080_007678 [Diaporthe eres]